MSREANRRREGPAMTRGGAWKIARRDVRALFDAPGGYLVIGIFWFVAGMQLLILLYLFREESLRAAQAGATHAGRLGVHVNDAVVQPLLTIYGLLLVFFVPLVTMRSFAEERRQGSLELLLSQPVRGVDVLAGKALGALLSVAICLGILVAHGFALAWISRPDWSAALAGLLGLVLLALFFVSLGVLISVVSRSQIEAAVLSLGALLALTIGPSAVRRGGGALDALLGFLAVMDRFQQFTYGMIDLGHVAFFLGGSLLFLGLALRSLDLVRWQGS
jgi:ABC-2 type transport system permease protein